MADVSITIRRNNGVNITATSVIEDALVVDMASTLAALMFDAATTPTEAPAPE